VNDTHDDVFRVPPLLTDANRDFWLGGRDGKLLIPRCARCRRWSLSPARLCPYCLSDDVPSEAASGRGQVAAFTINHHQWIPGRVVDPYVIAIIELPEEPGLRIVSNVVNCATEEVGTGMPVTVLFRELDDVWIPLFEPA
jgi:uncharacterized OB-fold protein